MARIPLRSYNREIENLIERGQIEEAIAHGKNILKQYPKHIETYRLLGKAFLESQRYSEASDILQRVLSVIPDDFVAQLGMSIIREDEGNLDAAIWHMERAYEVDPFNRAVQDELRLLYGRRDGAEPPRIRLTRGSLVRMYARGELLPQAIAEIRAALAEDPHRLDLMVLLAQMYYQSGQRVEAAEIASNLIAKLPYSLEANRILMDILPGTNRAEEARNFQRRIFDLDPYAEFLTPNTPTSLQVPEQNVMVERVDWRPSSQESQSPDWASNIGVNWEAETETEPLPEWLDTLAPSPQSPPAAPPPPAEPPSSEAIPDFLRSAGWDFSPSESDTDSEPIQFEEEPAAEALPTSDIPDWLQSMAPSDFTAPAEADNQQMDWLGAILPPAQAEETEPVSFDWLAAAEDQSKLDSSETVSPVEPESDTSLPGAEPAAGSEIPDWLNELGAETPDSNLETTETLDGLPAWLRESADQSQDSDADQTLNWAEAPSEGDQAPASELPAWLQGGSTVAPIDSLPEWLADENLSDRPASLEQQVADLSILGEVDEKDTQEDGQDLTAWIEQLETEQVHAPAIEGEIQEAEQMPLPPEDLATLSPNESAAPQSEDAQAEPSESASMPDLNDMDAAMAWLEALAAKQGADAATLNITQPDQRSETMPGWIASAGETAPSEAEGEQPSDAAVHSEESLIPDWLRDDASMMQVAAEEMPSGEAELAEPEPLSELPSWLITSAQSEGEEPAELVDENQEAVQAVFPQSVEESTEQADTITVAEKAAPTELAQPDFNDMDATMAWLEALAARQGADPDSLKITPQEQRSEKTPEWITDAGTGLAPIPVEESLAEENIPDWLKEDTLEPAEAGPRGDEPEPINDWVSEFPPPAESTVGAEQSETDWNWPVEADSTPLQQPIAGEMSSIPDEEPASALSAWLIEEQTAPKSEAAARPAQPTISGPSLDDMDSTMAWLEALAAKQGADEATLKITPPEMRSTIPPDWIAQITTQSAEPAQQEVTAPEPAASQSFEPFEPEQQSLEEPNAPTPEIEDISQVEIDVPAIAEITETPAPPQAVSEVDIPDWLLNYEQQQEMTVEGASNAGVEENAADDNFTRWLQSHHPEAGQEAPDITEAVDLSADLAQPSAERAAPLLLVQADEALNQGDTNLAASIYLQALETGTDLSSIIDRLTRATTSHPDDATVWQTLGDAYIRADRVQDALDAYTRAEELLQ